MGRLLCESLCRSAGTDRLPELGLGTPTGGERGRRHRRRGHLPEHRPALLRGRQPPRPCHRDRRSTTAAGPGSRPTIVGWPTSAPRCRGVGPGWPRSSPTTSTTRCPRSGGRRTTSDRPAGSCFPHRSGLGAARSVGVVLRAAVGGVRGARHGGQHPRWRRAPGLRRRRGGPGHHAGRAPLVLAPVGLAPHPGRRRGAPPRPPRGPHRAGAGLAAPGPRDPRLVLRADDDGRRGRGRFLRRRGQGHVDGPVGVLRPELLGRGELPTGERVGRPSRGRGRADHVGFGLPPLGRLLSLQPHRTAGRVRHVRPDRDPPDARGQRRPCLRIRPGGPAPDRRPDRTDGRRGRHPRWPSRTTRPTRPATPSTDTRCSAPGRTGRPAQPGGCTPYSAFHHRASARSTGSLRSVAS